MSGKIKNLPCKSAGKFNIIWFSYFSLNKFSKNVIPTTMMSKVAPPLFWNSCHAGARKNLWLTDKPWTTVIYFLNEVYNMLWPPDTRLSKTIPRYLTRCKYMAHKKNLFYRDLTLFWKLFVLTLFRTRWRSRSLAFLTIFKSFCFEYLLLCSVPIAQKLLFIRTIQRLDTFLFC